MTKQELLERIETLEKRVRDLESRPATVILPHIPPTPTPPYAPRHPFVWRGNLSHA